MVQKIDSNPEFLEKNNYKNNKKNQLFFSGFIFLREEIDGVTLFFEGVSEN